MIKFYSEVHFQGSKEWNEKDKWSMAGEKQMQGVYYHLLWVEMYSLERYAEVLAPWRWPYLETDKLYTFAQMYKK